MNIRIKNPKSNILLFYIFLMSLITNFGKKQFHAKKPCMIGYIPHLYNRKYLNNYYLTLNNDKRK